jgi:hypothetical protein
LIWVNSSPEDCAGAGNVGEELGTARRDKPRAAVGRAAAARRSPQSPASVHGWFTEGFDTADLKEAKALLEERA